VVAGAAGEGDHEGHGHIHLPSPSLMPLIAAFGMPIIGYGLIYKAFPVAIVGGLITLLGFFGWVFEPATAEDEH